VKKLKFWGKKVKKEAIPPAPPIPIPRGYKTVERTALYEPFAHAVIVQNPATGEYKYILDELALDPFERGIYDRILEILLAEIRSPKEEIKDPRVFFDTEAKKIIEKYRISLRKYENLETNLLFREDEELDNLMVKLVHMAGKHVSSAFPIVDASLPGKHRLAVCYRREVTPFGTTFTIRKFREDPYSIIDLINLGTLSEELAAYFWAILEHRASIMVLGGTAAGKTTALNALACLIKPGSKLLTIEETAELNLSHENWVSLISRRSYGLGQNQAGEVSLFDLVKASMRHRPDYLIVGEVRGSEAYVLFQALATGHGGMCTMHAESVNSAVKRLTQKPMDIAPAYIPLMNVVGIIRRVHLPKAGEMKAYRRITSVDEIADYEKYGKVFEWEPTEDVFGSSLSQSLLLSKLSKGLGVSQQDLIDEIERRKNVLSWMRRRNIRSYTDVSQTITEYYSRPKKFYEKKVEPVVSAQLP